MSAAFLQAAFPEPFIVMGKRLKPFTLGHQLLLERVESCYAIGSQKPFSYEDLLVSVFICSRTYSETLLAFSCPLWISLHNKLWAWRCGEFDIHEAATRFRSYLEANTKEPAFSELHSSDGPRGGVPMVQFLALKNQELTGITREQAMDLPYIQAVWNWLTHLESQGVVRLWTDDDHELAAKAERMREKLKAWGGMT